MKSIGLQSKHTELPRSGSVPSKSEHGRRPRARRSSPQKATAVKAERGLSDEREHAGHPHLSGSLDAEFFSVEQVATVLNVCERTVRRWIDAGKLIAHDLEGIIRIAGSDLAYFIGRRRRI